MILALPLQWLFCHEFAIPFHWYQRVPCLAPTEERKPASLMCMFKMILAFYWFLALTWFYSQVETADLEASPASYKLDLNMRYVLKVNWTTVSLARIELRFICFVISEITSSLSSGDVDFLLGNNDQELCCWREQTVTCANFWLPMVFLKQYVCSGIHYLNIRIAYIDLWSLPIVYSRTQHRKMYKMGSILSVSPSP